MKKTLLLLAALATTINMASAQFNANSKWYGGSTIITCSSESSKSFLFEYDDGRLFSLTRTSGNNFSVSDGYYHPKIKTAEYRIVEGNKVLLFKDAKGNILQHFKQSNNQWKTEMEKGYHQILDGTYVDETGVKYTFDGNTLTIGSNKFSFSLDPGMYSLLHINDAAYWWEVSATGINLYNALEGKISFEQGNLWHKLREVTPNGRWTFLSNEIVEGDFMWSYPSGIIRIIRNEIYARHGYVFNSADLKAYFSKQPWYKPLNNNAAVKLSAIETLNVEILKANETAAREGTDDMTIDDGL